MKDRFVVGEVYFEVKYPDPSMKYPLIESFVFLGKNLSDEETEDTWYFQYADSFAKHGSVLTSRGGDRRVACLTERELGEMFDNEGLLKKLIAARDRRVAERE